jgi:hypothetical protein
MRRNRRRAGSCGNKPHGDRPGGCFYAAQERGEVASRGGERSGKEHSPAAPFSTDIGLSRKDIHEARTIRDAEVADPALV